MERMAAELQGDIQQYRREHDALVQQRAAYERRVLELGTELTDLERTFDGSVSDAPVMDLGCMCGTDHKYLNHRQRQRTTDDGATAAGGAAGEAAEAE